MASGESVNCEETEKELMKNVFYNEFGLQFVVKGKKKMSLVIEYVENVVGKLKAIFWEWNMINLVG